MASPGHFSGWDFTPRLSTAGERVYLQRLETESALLGKGCPRLRNVEWREKTIVAALMRKLRERGAGAAG